MELILIKQQHIPEVKVGVLHGAEVFNRENGSFTIQHEVDHNLGILIIDKIN